jgi:hypothetical protein
MERPTPYPLVRRLYGSQSQSGSSGEEKNFQPLLGIEPYSPDRSARNLPTENCSIDVFVTFSIETKFKSVLYNIFRKAWQVTFIRRIG